MTFHFDPETHTYTVDGREIISITKALNEWVEVDRYGQKLYVNRITGACIEQDQMEKAGRFGNAIHKAFYMLVQGKSLDMAKLEAGGLLPVVKQIEMWIERHKPVPILAETPMYHDSMDYAGTPDLFCTVKGDKHIHCWEVKTSNEHPLVGAQAMAQVFMFMHNNKYYKKIKRHVLHLPKDGSQYRVRELRNDLSDGMYFKAALHMRKHEVRIWR